MTVKPAASPSTARGELHPSVRAWLKRLAARPQWRKEGHTGCLARDQGLTTDVVATKRGTTMPVEKARARFGPRWYETCKFTGQECLTKKGLAALKKKRLASPNQRRDR